MIERPIPFKAPMVRALLDGRKTQTREIVKFFGRDLETFLLLKNQAACCPYGMPGHRLWVRESWRAGALNDPDAPRNLHEGTTPIHYNADGSTHDGFGKARRSIQMPRWVSRVTLEVTGVRVERLHDISESDCWAEGIEEVMYDFDDAVQAQMAKRLGCCIEDVKPLYALWWEREHGPGSWAANPWLWAIKFKRIDKAGAP